MFYRIRGAHVSDVRVLPGVSARATLTQEVVIPVELHLNVVEMLAVFFTQVSAIAVFQEPVLFGYEALDVLVN